MNRMKLFVITLLAIAPLCVVAQNSMPLLTMMEGKFSRVAWRHYGCNMDFNDDGCCDLAISQPYSYSGILPPSVRVADLTKQFSYWRLIALEV